MLAEHEVEYRYREYTDEPLGLEELRGIVAKLGVGPAALLRKRDDAYKKLGLDGSEPEETLLAHMAQHPTLVQRPIAILGSKAVICRPAEELLQLLQ